MRTSLVVLFTGLLLVLQPGPAGWSAPANTGSSGLEGAVRQDTLEGSVSHDEQGRGVVGLRYIEFLDRPFLGPESTKQYIVVKVIKDGPADLSGIKKGDRILAIDGKETRNLPRRSVTGRIMGRPGTVVTLRLRRNHELLNVALTRVDLDALPDPQHRELLLKQEQASELEQQLVFARQMASLAGASGQPEDSTSDLNLPLSERQKAIAECSAAGRLIEQMDYAAAARKLKQAVGVDPTYVEARHFYGVVLDRLGKTAEAAEQLRECVQLRPDMANAWRALGLIQARQGRLRDAVEAFKQYIQLSPDCDNESEVRSTISVLEEEIARSPVKVSPDSDEYLAETTQNVRACWSTRRMPIRVYVPEANSISGFKPEFNIILRNAFADWADVSEGTITFSYVDKPKAADIECVWTDDPKDLRFISEGGEARVTRRGPEIVSARILLLTVRGPHKVPLSDETLRMVALHEVGHALGLQGHSSNPKDIMFVSGNPDGVLSSRDRKTLIALYKSSIPRAGFGMPNSLK